MTSLFCFVYVILMVFSLLLEHDDEKHLSMLRKVFLDFQSRKSVNFNLTCISDPKYPIRAHWTCFNVACSIVPTDREPGIEQAIF